jgi:uncharacterized protein DUF5677
MVPSPPSTDRLIEALRHASAFLHELKTVPIQNESAFEEPDPGAEPIPKKLKLPYDVAALSLLRVQALPPGIILLLERGEVVAAEPSIRVLLEIVFNVGWIGLDQTKAEQFRNEGLVAAEKWFSDRKKEGLRLPPKSEEWLQKLLAERTEGTKKLPTRPVRAEQVNLDSERFKIAGVRNAYVEYQRLSAAAHADYWHLVAFTEPKAALLLGAQAAVGATMFAIMVTAEPLGFGPRADKIVRELRDAFLGTVEE